mgnify:CR=1 FL=1
MNECSAMNQSPPGDAPKQIYKVYSIVEKPGDQKNVWLDIGIARTNRDDSITCKLDCLPLNGTIQLRIHEPRSQKGSINNSSPKSWQREGF